MLAMADDLTASPASQDPQLPPTRLHRSRRTPINADVHVCEGFDRAAMEGV